MNTIQSGSIGSTATDGHFFHNANVKKTQQELAPASAAEVSQFLEKNLQEVDETVRHLQSISNEFLGHTVKFNVNKELGKVVVEVVDASTNRVIREIPSEALQKAQVNMKNAIGLLFDDVI